MVEYETFLFSGRPVYEFLLAYFGAANNTEIGLAGATFVKDHLLEDPEAIVTHSYGARGVDVNSRRGRLETKVTKYLLSNRNGIVQQNLREYRRREVAEDGILHVCPLAVFPPQEGEASPREDEI